MGTQSGSETNRGFSSSSLRLSAHIVAWSEDKASADLLGLEWAALQGQYYKSGNSIKYVTKGSIIACDSGTLFSRIDLPVDHGIEAKANRLSILTTEDYSSLNISSFGICKKKYASTGSYFCSPIISNRWSQSGSTTTANNQAALLQADAFAVCSAGGIICVKEVNKTPQESLMAIFREQYGFDERTTKIILQLYKAIQDKYPDESQMTKDWRFTRLLGGLTYALKEKDGAAKAEAWNETAGNAIPASTQTAILTPVTNNLGQDLVVVTRLPLVEAYMRLELGLSSEDYQYLQYKVRIQNHLAGRDASLEKYKQTGDEGDISYNNDALKNMSTGLGRTIELTEFIKTWNEQCDDMCGMTDFAHQQVITAAILATEVSKYGTIADLVFLGDDRKREQMAGWLGDSVLSEKPGQKPSMGNDDYMADLDAENIAHMIRNENYSFINAIEDYYERRLLKDSRAKLFLENNDINDIKRLIYDQLLLVEYNDKLLRMEWGDFKGKAALTELYEFELFNWLVLLRDDKAPDTYYFIRSLEQGLSEMEAPDDKS